MEAILRLVQANQITDYDLSSLRTPIREGVFFASENKDGWQYQCGGNTGNLTVGQVIVIDPSQQMAALVLEKIPENPRQILLKIGLSIGRREDNDVVLADGLVSGQHCRLELLSDGWHLKDLCSTNGTFVNDQRIDDVPLHRGDVIKLGRYRFRVDSSLVLENADQRVHFAVPTQLPVLDASTCVAVYPWYSRSPRLLCPPEPLSVTIEDAPTIGNKPTMGLGGLSINPAMIAMNLGNQVLRYGLGKKKYAKIEKQQETVYTDYLQKIEQQLKEHADAQRAYAQLLHPSVSDCLSRVNGPASNLWERQTGDLDFLTIRLGTGAVPTATEIKVPQQHLQLRQTEMDKKPAELAECYATIPQMPVFCDLLKDGSCGLVGSLQDTNALLQDAVVQLAALHSYEDVKLVVICSQTNVRNWAWMRWLPHCQSEDGKHRFVLSGEHDRETVDALEHMAQQRLQSQGETSFRGFQTNRTHYVVIVPDAGTSIGSNLRRALMLNQPELGITGIFAGEVSSQIPHSVRNLIQIYAEELLLQTAQGIHKIQPEPSNLTLRQYEQFSRTLAPIRMRSENRKNLPAYVPFLESLGIDRLEDLDLGAVWNAANAGRSMAVPIGVLPDGKHFVFDIHEKAHGPHGLVAGMTGSGKSEMVMSWILSMAMRFSPQDVSFVLVDFKGTGLIKPFEKLPHLAGTISDLDVNISRNLVALNSELERRKALFDSVGVNKISDYLRLYHSGQVTEPLPYLFVVIDEYAEFKTQFPHFTNRVNSLFRVGRSLGVHIVLMTQNPAGVVSGESESNVRFRWCLKVASPSASREMLGNHTDAAYLTDPGRAFVQVGSDEVFEAVQSFYSGAPYVPGNASKEAEEIFRLSTSGKSEKIQLLRPKNSALTQMDAIVSYIADYTVQHSIAPAHRIWQDRMADILYLPDLQVDSEDTLALEPVVGMVDDPAGQKQLPLALPLGSNGHVAVFGSPGSGKTVFLQTVAMSLCSTYSPDDVNLYAMDFGSWSLGAFMDFPHMCMVANGSEEDSLKQIAESLIRELQQRRVRFAEVGAGNLRTFRKLSDAPMPYIVLLVDRFEVARTTAGLEDFFLQISREGSNYGIYLVLTTGSTSGLGFKLEQNFKTKLALQLSNPSDYASVVGRTGGLLPEGYPGRGLINLGGVKEFQIACPVKPWSEDAGAVAIRALGEEILHKWGPRRADCLRTIPSVLDFGAVTADDGKPVLGVYCDTIEPAKVDFSYSHSLLISGTQGSGKTTLLKTLTRQLLSEDCEVTVFGTAEAWDTVSGVQQLRSGQDADGFMEQLRTVLVQRQNERKENPDTTFTRKVLIIDGYRSFFDTIAQQTADRLKALLMAGKGLDVCVIAADRASELTTLMQFREPSTQLLSRGPAVVLGGKAADHLCIDLGLGITDKATKLRSWEGWYRSAEGVKQIKVMNCQ